jgi:hypothetical protein
MRNTEKVRRSAAPNLLVQFPLAELILQLVVDPSKSRRSIPAKTEGRSQQEPTVDPDSRQPPPANTAFDTMPGCYCPELRQAPISEAISSSELLSPVRTPLRFPLPAGEPLLTFFFCCDSSRAAENSMSTAMAELP